MTRITLEALSASLDNCLSHRLKRNHNRTHRLLELKVIPCLVLGQHQSCSDFSQCVSRSNQVSLSRAQPFDARRFTP